MALTKVRVELGHAIKMNISKMSVVCYRLSGLIHLPGYG